MKTVAVIGAGFEGLLACHTVQLKGNAVALFDVSPDFDFQLPVEKGLPHDAIVSMLFENDRTASVRHSFRMDGRESKYKEKAWPTVKTKRMVSILEAGTMVHSASSFFETLKNFYQVHESNVLDNCNYEILDQLVSESNISKVICTLPKSMFCKKLDSEFDAPCTFNSETGYFIDYLIQPMSTGKAKTFYDATPDVSWHKMGNYFDLQFTEWTTQHPYIDSKPFLRPISNNCNCNPDVHFVGRAGKWEGLDRPYDEVLIDTMAIVA